VITLDLAFVIQLINFLILLVVLNILLYRPLRRVMAERDNDIKGARSKAADVDREVQERIAEYETRLREVKSGASQERAGLKQEALAEESVILEKARKDAAESIAAIKAKVAQEAAEATRILQEQAHDLSRDICEKVLGRSL
jgi:F-type H+-transporting ATPase subunit b